MHSKEPTHRDLRDSLLNHIWSSPRYYIWSTTDGLDNLTWISRNIDSVYNPVSQSVGTSVWRVARESIEMPVAKLLAKYEFTKICS